MENETKMADLRVEATDQALEKKNEKLSLFDRIYYSILIISLLAIAVGMGSLIVEHLFK